MLTQYMKDGRNIPLSDVHKFWRKLSITPFTEGQKDKVTINMEMDIVWSTFATAIIPQKKEI